MTISYDTANTYWPSVINSYSGIQKLKPVLNDEEYQRILDFPYIKTNEDFNEFSKWIEDSEDIPAEVKGL